MRVLVSRGGCELHGREAVERRQPMFACTRMAQWDDDGLLHRTSKRVGMRAAQSFEKHLSENLARGFARLQSPARPSAQAAQFV